MYPVAHGKQFWFDASLYVPPVQIVQEPAPAELILPGLQVVQEVLLAEEKVPADHCKQAVWAGLL